MSEKLLTYSEALSLAQNEGMLIYRNGWNGKNMFVFYVPEGKYPASRNGKQTLVGIFPEDLVPYRAYMAIKSVDDTVVPWTPSQSDQLSSDWNAVTAKDYQLSSETAKIAQYDVLSPETRLGLANTMILDFHRLGGGLAFIAYLKSKLEAVDIYMSDNGMAVLISQLEKSNEMPITESLLTESFKVFHNAINGKYDSLELGDTTTLSNITNSQFMYKDNDGSDLLVEIEESGLITSFTTDTDELPSKVQIEFLEAQINKVKFRNFKNTSMTHCTITLNNTFEVTGESNCVSALNFDKEIGEVIAYKNAFAKLWELYGFLLCDLRYYNE